MFLLLLGLVFTKSRTGAALDAMPLKGLPFHHKDPFDRMLIAQGISRDFTIMTHDAKFNQYECKLI